jgi:tryptophanyl-tRNA synthetase
MSKSYSNTIGLFEEESVIKKQVMSIKTASVDLAEAMPIEDDLILNLYSQFASAQEVESLKSNYAAGGFGYGRAKQALFEKLMEFFAEARARRETLEASKNIEEIMAAGSEKARQMASKTLTQVYERTGLR